MLYLLIFSVLTLLCVYYIKRIEAFAKVLKKGTNLPISECRLEAVNLVLYESWIPVLIKVYAIGVLETLFITLCKRGLFVGTPTQQENEKSVDELIKKYKHSGRQKIAVITGGDSGIGFEICKGLLLANFHVILGTRSKSSCEVVLKNLKNITGSNKISSIEVDLTSFKSVHQFSEEVKRQVPNKNIQLLINNAGVMNIPYQKTKDGYESQCQTNYLSPFLLTQLLLPWIQPNTGKILFASSSTLYATRQLNLKSFTDKYTLNGLDHYAFSKSCVAHLVHEFSKTTPIKVYSYHPGTVRTKLFSHTTVFNLPFVSKLFDFIMLSPKEGSKTPLYLSLTPNLGESGTYWANERVQTLPLVFVNGKKRDVKALYDHTVAQCGLKK